MSYAVLSPGKRVRPVLTLAVSELIEVDKKRLIPFSLAVEFIHSASLIHDDLPALDNDTLRRGKPTAHVRYGEALALLGGDALFGKAFQIVSSSGEDPEMITKLNSLLSQTLFDLCEGQAMEFAYDKEEMLNEEDIRNIHLKKTASLLSASAAAPGLFFDKNPSLYGILAEFGSCLGLLFQITDDILDQDEEKKTTYIHAIGLEGSKDRAREEHSKLLQILKPFGERAWFLRELCDYVLNRQQ